MDYRLLGPLEVWQDGRTISLGGRRQRAVLAVLLLADGRPVALDALVEQVWADAAPPTAVGTLQAYVANLRRLLEPDRLPRTPARVLTSVPGGYRLVTGEGAVDLQRFDAATRVARAAWQAGDPQATADAARRALAQWRGPALADLGDERFATAHVRRLEEARLQVLGLRIDADLALGRHHELIGELIALVEAHPLREDLRGQLMRALYAAGRQAEALEVARIGRTLLAEELGVDPDPAIRALEAAILRQDPDLGPVPTPGPSAPGKPAGRRAVGMVGRAAQLDALHRALDGVAGGRGRIVLVTGEPGIGKTRLVEAFASQVTDAPVLWGRCVESGGAPPFWPWRQVLQALAAQVGAVPVREALGEDAGIVVDLAPELAAVIGPPIPIRLPDAEAARFHAFRAVTRALAMAAHDAPLVVVLEDLHWVDEASAGLLRVLAATVADSRLLVVGTYRDVAAGDGRRLTSSLGSLAHDPDTERLHLQGLDDHAITTLIGQVLDHDPDDRLATAVLDRTGGNPLFAMHLARLLQGEIAAGGDPLTVVRTAVPPAVIDLIRLRVAQLPTATTTLLEVAAVIGRTFELALLVQVAADTFDAALDAIVPAVGAGLVVEDPVPGRYRFTHAVMREAILAGLGPTRVGRLHGMVGDALAARGSDARSLPSLAHHYWQAAGVGWADAALASAVQAATAAVAGLAYEDAQRHLDRALLLLADLPAGTARDRSELAVRLQQATHLMRTRGYAVPQVAAACERARDLAASLDAPAEVLIANWGLAAHHLVCSRHRTALAIGAELLALADRTADPVARQAGHQVSGVTSLYLGRPGDAVAHLQQAVQIARTLPSAVLARFPQDVEVGGIAFLAVAHWLLGDPQQADVSRQQALARARQLGGYDEVFALMVSAQLSVLQRHLARVLADTEVMLDRCGPAGFGHLAAHARVMRGWALALDGRAGEGLRLLEEGIGYFDAHERSTRRSHNLTLLAEALAVAGRVGQAHRRIAEAMGELAQGEERFFEARTREVWATLDTPSVPSAASRR